MLIATAFLAASALPAAAVGTGSVSGTVTAAAGGAPLAGVCVSAHLTDINSTLVATVATAGDGSYTLSAVPVGNVNVHFSDTGSCVGGVAANLVGQWWNSQPSLSTAVTVAVADSVTTTGVNAALVAGGSISGTVTAATGGAPLNAICVGAFVLGVDALLVSSTATAADGTYTLTGVPAQNVLVEFFASGQCPGGTPANFEGQWYNNKLTAGTADSVTVTAGTTVAGISAALNASGSFSGTVTAAVGGAPLSGICVAAYLPFASGVAPQLIASTSTAADGTYTLPGAPVGNIDVKFYSTGFCPGGAASNYAMQWYNNQPLQGTANPITITSGATTPNINAALIAGGTITGTVTAQAGGAALSGICVAVFSTGASPVVVASTGTANDGTYMLSGVPAGTVRVRFNSQGFCPGGIFQHFATQWDNNKPNFVAGDDVTVTAGATTPNINAAMAPPIATSFSIAVNGSASASIQRGTQATLSESGLAATYGPVVFSSLGHANLCTITFPGTATSCQTSATLAAGSYTPISATFTDADGAFTSSTSTNKVSLTVNPNPTTFAIHVNGGSSATILHGTQATLSETGLPDSATGSVVFSAFGQPHLCTITLPETSCLTSIALPLGSYNPISATFTDTDGNFAGSTSTTTVSLNVNPNPTSFTISVNGGSSATTLHGTHATLSETGLPGPATGTIVFGTSAHPNLCTITLPATSCTTPAALDVGTYASISATFTPTDTNYIASTSANTLSLNDLSKPGAPTHVHAAKVSPKKATVSWTAPTVNGGTPITAYLITYGAKTIRVSASARQATFLNLPKGTHHFNVRAINSVGLSAWSAPSNPVNIKV